MSRYNDTNESIFKNPELNPNKRDGFPKKDTTIYSKIPESNDDLWVMSQHGDRFDMLAFQYYKDPHLWWYIAKANNMKFNNIPEGTVLRIPSSLEFAKGN